MSVPKTAMASRSVRIGVALTVVAAALIGTAAAATMAASTASNPSTVVPVPAGMIKSSDPQCTKDPTASFCRNSSLYVVNSSPLVAHTKWVPGLAKWGLTKVDDTCTTNPVQAATFCVMQGVHSGTKVTVLFKAQYDVRYSPTAVKTRTNTIQQKANAAATHAPTAVTKAKILRDATQQINAIRAAAEVWNRAHSKTLVDVTMTK